MTNESEVWTVAAACAELEDRDHATELANSAAEHAETRSDWLNGARYGVPYEFRGALPTVPGVRSWVAEVFRDSVRCAGGSVASINRGRGLLLQGPLGTGKTFEAVGAARAIALGGLAGFIRIITMSDFYDEVRPGGDGQAFAKLAAAPLLVLDDLGASRDSAWTEEQDYRLIDARYREGRRTIVTTNYAPVGWQPKDDRGRPSGAYMPSFEERVGARIASRIEHMCARVPVKGTDRRRGAA